MDEIGEYMIAVNRDGEVKKLKEEQDFHVTKYRNDENRAVNYYHIHRENFSEEGSYEVIITSEDKAENKVSNQSVKSTKGPLPIRFTVDKTAPTVVVSGARDGGRYMTAGIHVMLDVKDNLALDTLSVTVDEKEPKVFTQEELESAGGIVKIFVPGSGRRQRITITAADKAGNVLGQQEPVGEGVPMELSVLVTPNVLIQFFMNKPLFWGTAAGVLALLLLAGGGKYFGRRRQE